LYFEYIGNQNPDVSDFEAVVNTIHYVDVLSIADNIVGAVRSDHGVDIIVISAVRCTYYCVATLTYSIIDCGEFL
jgi:O-acetylhomoserine/O-acetylserine sulfhydrylase-like pyridoxal-dependent enzyme